MLSIIIYGRNDDHGYNYHKRLAISLNCIAEALSDTRDEIIFTDYNSPDDFPTVVEAIQDTLTAKAKQHLRILRIRSHHHKRCKKTHLSILETVSRNAAIRRSNPENKWILSTNPDMIFVPSEPTDTLTSLVEALPDGFYLLPRFSLPESFWELSLDRSSPKKNIDFLRNQSEVFHLKTIVRRQGFLKYDNPGDFQLMLRNDIFQIGGFDEQMVKGWHVDSNLCKRMDLLGRTGKSLEKELLAFHCDHNRKESLVHKRIVENDWERFVCQVSSAECSNTNWGLYDEVIEEIRLKNNPHLSALSSALSQSVKMNCEIDIHVNNFNTPTYAPSRIFASLADHLCHLSKTVEIAYVGYNIELIKILHKYLNEKGFSKKIICLDGFLDGQLPSSVVLAEMSQLIFQADLFICDFGIDENRSYGKEDFIIHRKQLKQVMMSFLDIIRKRKAQKRSGTFIGINVLHTDFKSIFSKDLLIRSNGHSTGICYGFLPVKSKFVRWKMSSILHYCMARYFFNYSDSLRSFLARTKLTKKLFKSLQ
ncbi:MAG TPA: hypothetical protein VFU89_02420 [Rhabdochlamydiaceae bacterium]|nr:hypothetical protein [Rhabdochlamydiaceae bacterium]